MVSLIRYNPPKLSKAGIARVAQVVLHGQLYWVNLSSGLRGRIRMSDPMRLQKYETPSFT